MTQARDWALERFRALAFANVHAEGFTRDHARVRGAELAALIAPVERPLAVLSGVSRRLA